MDKIEEEENNDQNFEEGNDVIINQSKGKIIIGKIQSIQDNKVYFVKYFYPEETKGYTLYRQFTIFVAGRQSYQSKYELLKSDVHDLTTLDKLERKIVILKNLEEFISKPFDEIQDQRIFIIRQFYDAHNFQCVPDTIKEHTCFYCHTIVNPDEKIMKCTGCDYFYHTKCLLDLNVKQCPNQNCEQLFDQSRIEGELFQKNQFLFEEMNLKRKPISDPEIEFIPLKKQSSKFTLKNTSQYSVKTSLQGGQIALNKHLNEKKNNQRPFQNINDNHYEKLKKAIEKYKAQYSAKFSKGVQKDREAAKENLFSNFMYGLAELKESHNDNQELTAEEQVLAKKNEIEQFDIAKSLAISIETCIFLIHNDNNKHQIKNNYRQKFRELLANLKDDKNSVSQVYSIKLFQELRFSILRGSITPDKLSKMSGRELANSEKKREWKKREEIVLKSKTLIDQAEIIAKNHKGQEIIQIEQHEALNNVEEEVDEDEKISEGFSDIDEEQNGIDSKGQPQNTKVNKENLELQNQLNSLINGKQKDKLIQRMERHLPQQISQRLITKFKL